MIEAANEDLRLMLLFAASTGARAGEQWAARWRDVDFDKVEFQIVRRVDVYGDEGAPKSSAGVRAVPLSGQLVAMLKAWKLKSEFSKSDDLIFPNREGNYLGHDNLIKRQFLPLFDAFAKHGRSKRRLQLAWPPTLRSLMLDRSRARPKDSADLCRPRVVASHDGSVRAPISERRSSESDGPDREWIIQMIVDIVL